MSSTSLSAMRQIVELSMVQSTTFDDVPDDVLAGCLIFLNARDLLRCRQVSSRFLNLINEDVLLRYQVELYAVNMLDGSSSTMNTKGRLELLLEYQRRLRRPKPAKFCSILNTKLPPRIVGQGAEATAFEGSIFVTWRTQAEFVFCTQLPSPALGIRARKLNLHLVNAKICHLAIDQSQDLLVTLEIAELGTWRRYPCIRRLSTGGAHPLAANPLCCEESVNIDSDNFHESVRVQGDHLMLFAQPFGDPQEHIYICNWKTSSLVTHIRRPEILGMEFLSDRFLMLYEKIDHSRTLVLHICDAFNQENPIVCTLELPSVAHPVFKAGTMWHARIQVGCNPSSQGAISGTPPPFMPSMALENKIVLVTLSNSTVGGFIVITLASDLLRMARENYDSKQDGAVRVSWEDWGPKITRVIEVDHRSSFMISVYGAMALVPDKDGYMLYDFNQKTIRRDLARSTGDNSLTENIFTEPTVIDNGNLFKSSVTSNLPCRITKVAFEGINQGRAARLCRDTVAFLPSFEDDRVDVFSL